MGCARRIGSFLQAELLTGRLADLPIEIRYVPIVLPIEYHARYKERSRVRLKQQIYDCAPILDYQTFVSGDTADQTREYIRGLETSAAYLPRLGANEEQVAEFREALAKASRQP